jgi:hypothetical protein
MVTAGHVAKSRRVNDIVGMNGRMRDKVGMNGVQFKLAPPSDHT